MPTSLRTAYRERLAQGEIKPDVAQAAAVEALSRLEADLDNAGEPGFSLFGRKPKGVSVGADHGFAAIGEGFADRIFNQLEERAIWARFGL